MNNPDKTPPAGLRQELMKVLAGMKGEDRKKARQLIAHRLNVHPDSPYVDTVLEKFARGELPKAKTLSEMAPDVDHRSYVEIMNSYELRAVTGERPQYRLPNEPTLPRFTPPARWKPSDAVRMAAHMAYFNTTAYGVLAAMSLMASSGQNHEPELLNVRCQQLYRFWSDPQTLLISADEAFTSMVHAAALSAPTGPLHRDELLANTGVIFFESEAEPELFHQKKPVRAMSWICDQAYLRLTVYCDGMREWETESGYDENPPEEIYYYLHEVDETGLYAIADDTYTQPGEVSERHPRLIAFLRSLAGVARSPKTMTRTKVVEPRRKRGRNRASRNAAGSVRVLSLRQPEHGHMELQAARGQASTDSRGMARHWVRGHWRNQWYPSLGSAGEHRQIWIDGFIRGDAEHGNTPTATVYRARGDQ